MAMTEVRGPMAGVPEAGTMAETLAREVHAAWRDGMLKQGRVIPVERLEWETLSEQDKVLDRFIASRLVAAVLAATITETGGSDGG